MTPLRAENDGFLVNSEEPLGQPFFAIGDRNGRCVGKSDMLQCDPNGQDGVWLWFWLLLFRGLRLAGWPPAVIRSDTPVRSDLSPTRDGCGIAERHRIR